MLPRNLLERTSHIEFETSDEIRSGESDSSEVFEKEHDNDTVTIHNANGDSREEVSKRYYIFTNTRYVMNIEDQERCILMVEKEFNGLNEQIKELKRLERNKAHLFGMWKNFFNFNLFDRYPGMERVVRHPEEFDTRLDHHVIADLSVNDPTQTMFMTEKFCSKVAFALNAKLPENEKRKNRNLPGIWKFISEYDDQGISSSLLDVFCELTLINIGEFNENELVEHREKFIGLAASNDYARFILLFNSEFLHGHSGTFIKAAQSKCADVFCEVLEIYYKEWCKAEKQGRTYTIPTHAKLMSDLKSRPSKAKFYKNINNEQRNGTIVYMKRRAENFAKLYLDQEEESKQKIETIAFRKQTLKRTHENDKDDKSEPPRKKYTKAERIEYAKKKKKEEEERTKKLDEANQKLADINLKLMMKDKIIDELKLRVQKSAK